MKHRAVITETDSGYRWVIQSRLPFIPFWMEGEYPVEGCQTTLKLAEQNARYALERVRKYPTKVVKVIE